MKPDLDLIVKDDDGAVRARCSCWWSTGHTLDVGRPDERIGERIGVIGHYSAESADAGTRVLTDACAQLAAHGCTIAVGPMDGNTWRSYRLVIERGSEPPFFLEPDTPDAWVSHFTAAGFETLATYSSALARDLTQRDPRLDALASRLAARNIVIRPLDLSHADDDLRRIFALSLIAFKDNFLYTPIDEAEFMEQNRRLLPAVRPELVLLAEQHGATGSACRLSLRGARPPSAEARTDARYDHHQDGRRAARARARGPWAASSSPRCSSAPPRSATRAPCTRLMHEQNVSRNISRRYAETIRRYALFAKRLATPSQRRSWARHEHRRNPPASCGRSRQRRGHRRSPRSADLPRTGRGIGARRRAARTAWAWSRRSGADSVPDVERSLRHADRSVPTRRDGDVRRSFGGPPAPGTLLPIAGAEDVSRQREGAPAADHLAGDQADPASHRHRLVAAHSRARRRSRAASPVRRARRSRPSTNGRPRSSRSPAAAPASRKRPCARTDFCSRSMRCSKRVCRSRRATWI